MLRYRLAFGPLLILIWIGVFWLDARLDQVVLSGWMQSLFMGRTYLPSGLALLAWALTLIPLASWELNRILRADGVMVSFRLTCFAAVLGVLIHYSIPREVSSVNAVAIVSTALAGMFIFALAFFSRGRNVDGVVAAAGAVMFAMIYLGLLTGFYLALRRWVSPWVVLSVIMITKSCDIGAYFTGRAIGRRKLIPWLSPGKTWEGLLGGVITSSLVALGLAWIGNQVGSVEVRPGLTWRYDYHPLFAAGAGALFGLTGQLGDLVASLLKRDAGLKDSSSILPGFGGVLDVVDSPLVVAPLAFWLLVTAA